MKTVCICGGGNLGHVIAATLASSQNYIVNILTNRPQSWRQELTVELPDGTPTKQSLTWFLTGARHFINEKFCCLK
jgi:3-hydroxyacyl-CoA dehydrogenase